MASSPDNFKAFGLMDYSEEACPPHGELVAIAYGLEGNCRKKTHRHFVAIYIKQTKKPLRKKWLNRMILNLKFGGPYWT
ncbi:MULTISPECIES: hypothetical protein [unclassified Serratia (in: enterobacteria)]|uniref:hypothetical protein n=1 Tax=unclassified Serratia (in: enterobacteria) TaxID=2647522 RepID=UPI0012FF1718|nr:MULTISPECIES: hypothetical protein [unclassified Serratia (in: enterobacteria)]